MTTEQINVADEIAAARLEWLDAEARLAELLPTTQGQATTGAS